ncbi:MAG: response regulator [Thermodesulfobacteriota bacterium]
MQQDAAPIKALIIDDEESMRDACARVLTREGLLVQTAADGEAALEQARGFGPELILLDLKMPKLAGMPVLDELNELCPQAVKIVVTAYATVTTAMEAVRHGAYDFLAKPFTPDELRVMVRRGLDHLRLVRENQALTAQRDQARHQCLQDARRELAEPLAASRRSLAELLATPGLDGRARELALASARRLEAMAERLENLALPE